MYLTALSVLQNGKIPRIMSADILHDLFQSPSPSPCIDKLRIGLNALGVYEVLFYHKAIKKNSVFPVACQIKNRVGW